MEFVAERAEAALAVARHHLPPLFIPSNLQVVALADLLRDFETLPRNIVGVNVDFHKLNTYRRGDNVVKKGKPFGMANSKSEIRSAVRPP